MEKYLIICAAVIAVLILLAAVLPARYKGRLILDGDGMERRYTQITAEEAKARMQKDDGHIVVDVRRPDEYAAGHIPGAICIPNESIGEIPPTALSDFDQTILIYCRSGRRSKLAAQKLLDMGYNNVYEFGGILDWTGDIVTGEEPEQ